MDLDNVVNHPIVQTQQSANPAALLKGCGAAVGRGDLQRHTWTSGTAGEEPPTAAATCW